MTDLDELERLARGTDGGLGDDDPWPTAGDIAGGFSWNHLEAAYIAAASPDVTLDLIARVRAAEARANEARSIAEHYLAESSSIRSDEAIVRLTDVCEEIREATTKP